MIRSHYNSFVLQSFSTASGAMARGWLPENCGQRAAAIGNPTNKVRIQFFNIFFIPLSCHLITARPPSFHAASGADKERVISGYHQPRVVAITIRKKGEKCVFLCYSIILHTSYNHCPSSVIPCSIVRRHQRAHSMAFDTTRMGWRRRRR